MDATTSEGFGRRQLLDELIMIDLECRWRQQPTADSSEDESPRKAIPQKPRLEDDLERYPELGTAAELSLELISQEYQVRRRWGDVRRRRHSRRGDIARRCRRRAQVVAGSR